MDMLTIPLASNDWYLEMRLVRGRFPHSWLVVASSGKQQSLSDWATAMRFFQDIERVYRTPTSLMYASVQQDEAKDHEFVSLADAAFALKHGVTAALATFPESVVSKACSTSRAVMLHTRRDAKPRDDFSSDRSLSDASEKLQTMEQHRSLCVHAWPSWYVTIPELSFSRTQKLIVCDENTLCFELQDEIIFEHLKLIVNCHEASPSRQKYKAGAFGSEHKPRIVSQPVHEWPNHSDEEMGCANDEIQSAIWTALQSGSVAVHGVADVRLAACIVGCHFLWRFFVFAHHELPNDVERIFLRLQSIWPSLTDEYVPILSRYKEYLHKRAWKQLENSASELSKWTTELGPH